MVVDSFGIRPQLPDFTISVRAVFATYADGDYIKSFKDWHIANFECFIKAFLVLCKSANNQH